MSREGLLLIYITSAVLVSQTVHRTGCGCGSEQALAEELRQALVAMLKDRSARQCPAIISLCSNDSPGMRDGSRS